jgi:hypothetical protein
MTLGNMRELGVHHLIAFCHNDACRHQALIDVSKYSDETEVPSFRRRVKCGKMRGPRCGRAAELERAAAEREPDRQAVAMIDLLPMGSNRRAHERERAAARAAEAHLRVQQRKD